MGQSPPQQKMSNWKTNKTKPENNSKIEIIWSKTKYPEIDTWLDGKLQADFLTWDDVIFWRYMVELRDKENKI